MSDTPTKRCTKCGHEFPATPEYFYRRTASKDGLQSVCIPCRKVIKAKEYADHREEITARRRQRYADNPGPHKEQARQYYHEHRDVCLARVLVYQARHKHEKTEYDRLYYAKNQEKRAVQRKRWYKANPERVNHNRRRWIEANVDKARLMRRAITHRYRARKRAATGAHTGDDIRRQYVAQNGKCWWCDQELNGSFDVDHLVPLSRGGSDAPENIVIACQYCNRSKGGKLPHEWNGRLL